MVDYYDQSIYSYLYSPYYPYAYNDIVLTEPNLTNPTDQIKFCRRTGQTITLDWNAVANADAYVIQYCRNSEFSGPTLRAVEVNDPTTQVTLTVGTHIRYGTTYYWRVMAYSNTGGASPKSDVREFTIQCPTGEGTADEDDNLCDQISIEIDHPNFTRCVESVRFYARFTIPQDHSLALAEWSVTYEDGIAIRIDQSQTYLELELHPCGTSAEELTVTLHLWVYADAAPGIWQECTKEVRVVVICDDETCSVGTATKRVELDPNYGDPDVEINPYDLPVPAVPQPYMLSKSVERLTWNYSTYIYDPYEGNYYLNAGTYEPTYGIDDYNYGGPYYSLCPGHYLCDVYPLVSYLDLTKQTAEHLYATYDTDLYIANYGLYLESWQHHWLIYKNPSGIVVYCENTESLNDISVVELYDCT